MLSDILMPFLDLEAANPLDDYLDPWPAARPLEQVPRTGRDALP